MALGSSLQRPESPESLQSAESHAGAGDSQLGRVSAFNCPHLVPNVMEQRQPTVAGQIPTPQNIISTIRWFSSHAAMLWGPLGRSNAVTHPRLHGGSIPTGPGSQLLLEALASPGPRVQSLPAASWSHRSHRRGEGRVQRPGLSRGNGGQRWYKFAKADVHSAITPGLLTLPPETFSCTHGEDDHACRFFESLTMFLKCQRFHCFLKVTCQLCHFLISN